MEYKFVSLLALRWVRATRTHRVEIWGETGKVRGLRRGADRVRGAGEDEDERPRHLLGEATSEDARAGVCRMVSTRSSVARCLKIVRIVRKLE